MAATSSLEIPTTGSPQAAAPTWWRWLAVLEVSAAATVALLDWGIPSLVICLVAAVSLLVRRQHLATLGFHRVQQPWRLVRTMLGFAAAWTIVQLSLLIPLTNHLSGERQDMSDFGRLQGNLGLLLLLVTLSWTLAACGEELAFRGLLNTRLVEVFGGPSRAALVAAVAVSSVLFGAIHTEQGLVGMAAATLDGAFYSVLRYRYRTLWAAVLTHGFLNTIGFMAFYLVGPVYGFW